MPSPLFNVLFLVALIVPVAMYMIGMSILMISLLANHFGDRMRHERPIEAIAH